MAAPQIFCPLCRWQPRDSSRWVCSQNIGGCGTVWNTFDTGGICPECSWHWVITMCHSCKQYSPHKDWYHDPDEPPADAEEHEMKDEEAIDV